MKMRGTFRSFLKALGVILLVIILPLILGTWCPFIFSLLPRSP